MKWYNKKKTVCLNLDRISYWDYYEGSAVLKVYIDSSNPIVFYNEDAKEIYKILTSEKEVI